MKLPDTRSDLIPDFSATRFDSYEMDSLPMPDGELWVFGYGSLMWDPGFKVKQAIPARLYGYHRRLCLWSVHYRGTVKRPGLVLGLDRGGSCTGVALQVASEHVTTSSAYLLKREMLHNAYLPIIKNIYLQHGEQVAALTFVSKQEHPQFAPPLSVDETVSVVLEATGESGKNSEYVLNTAQHLSEFGIEHTELHAVAKNLQ